MRKHLFILSLAGLLLSLCGSVFAYSEGFFACDGQLVIPISGETGQYTLRLVTGRDLVFEGEFEI